MSKKNLCKCDHEFINVITTSMNVARKNIQGRYLLCPGCRVPNSWSSQYGIGGSISYNGRKGRAMISTTTISSSSRVFTTFRDVSILAGLMFGAKSVQPMVSDIFWCGYWDLLDTINDILSRTPAPKEYHKLIIKKIFLFVMSYIKGLACRNCDRRVKPFAIDIKYVGLLFNMVSACKPSIEALEKVRFEYQEKVEEECAICWDAFEYGCEATQLPSSHIFHGDCIVDWLKGSHACPFCRFQFLSSAEKF